MLLCGGGFPNGGMISPKSPKTEAATSVLFVPGTKHGDGDEEVTVAGLLSAVVGWVLRMKRKRG